MVFESSIFSGPIAQLVGEKVRPAILELADCTLNAVTPTEALAANEYGYFRVVRCRNGGGPLYADVLKWPALPPTLLDAGKSHIGKSLAEPAPATDSK